MGGPTYKVQVIIHTGFGSSNQSSNYGKNALFPTALSMIEWNLFNINEGPTRPPGCSLLYWELAVGSNLDSYLARWAL